MNDESQLQTPEGERAAPFWPLSRRRLHLDLKAPGGPSAVIRLIASAWFDSGSGQPRHARAEADADDGPEQQTSQEVGVATLGILTGGAPSSSRRAFLGLFAGALAALGLGPPVAALPLPGWMPTRPHPMPEAGPTPGWQLPPPGPDWERIPPRGPAGVGGWRNARTGQCWTDWVRRERSSARLDRPYFDAYLVQCRFSVGAADRQQPLAIGRSRW